MKVDFDSGQKQVLDEMLLGLPGVRAARMFGFPGYWAGKKLFACLFGPGVGFKLPPERAQEVLTKTGFSPFTPRGRRMAAWVMLVPKRPADLVRHANLFRESLEYVSGLRTAVRVRPARPGAPPDVPGHSRKPPKAAVKRGR
jgi:hypothetical protein